MAEVFGGSFTLGGGCRQPTATLKKEIIALKDCSWVARLKHWLQKAFPRATLHVENKAQGGSPAQVFLGGLGMYDFSGVDLILLDTLVNDAHERMMFSSDADVHKMDAMDGNFTVSVAFEEMLRSLHELAGPSAAVLALLAGCSPCIATANAHRQVLDFYRVPYLDFARAVETAAYLWVVAPQLLGTPGGTAHPEFQTHQAVADMFALSLTKVWDHMSHMTTEEVKIDQLDLNTAFHPAKYRNKFPRCIHPCSVFSALRKSTVQPKILQGNWTLYEDRPGKPGWISTEPGSVMEVELCFRQTPTFTFTYLRSYEKLGAVRLFLNGRNVTIPGLWTWSAAARVSQSETFFSNAAQNILTGNINQVVGFNVKPYSTLQLRIENLRAHQADNKMKVIEIVSCWLGSWHGPIWRPMTCAKKWSSKCGGGCFWFNARDVGTGLTLTFCMLNPA